MMGDDSVTVVPAELLRHAGHVDQVAAGLALAADAGSTTRPGPEAYGRLCVIVPALLDELQEVIVDGISSAARSLEDTADRLRVAAEGYTSADHRSETALRHAGRLE